MSEKIQELNYDENIGKWIIDTDPGCDDAFAIIFAMNFIKENLLALSIEGGNVGIEQTYSNAKKVCVVNGKEHVPVYKGCKLNISCTKYSGEDFHGKDGLFDIEKFYNFEEKYDEDICTKSKQKYRYLQETCNPIIEECSALKIIELCYQYDNVNLLTIGPLTNLAVAFMIDPNIVNRIKQLVVMGGSFNHRGNMQLSAEFNFCVDPIAAKITFNNFKNIIVFPWETSELHQLYLEQIKTEAFTDNNLSYFCREIILKKAKIEGGIFPDYVAAVGSFFPKSIKKMNKYNCDIVIDSSDAVNGAFVITKSNCLVNQGNNKKEVWVVEELDERLFYHFFEFMIQ